MAESDVQVYAQISLRSRTGASLFADYAQLSFNTLEQFAAGIHERDQLQQKLESAGFTVIAATRFGLSILGPEKAYADYFGSNVLRRVVELSAGATRKLQVSGAFFADEPKLPQEVANLAERLYIPRIGQFLAGEGAMPTPGYYHLCPPADISRLTNADAAHTRGYRGTGVRVAMVDSGFVADHDYYEGRGYTITVQAAVGLTTQDEVGHGTGIASNLLAIAPDCDFLFVKMFDGMNWAARAGFVMAVAGGARIITNSWGQWHDPLLEVDIIDAVASGVTVIFACGNGGPVGWPGCMDEVISVGGAFPLAGGGWEASSYASSGTNALVPGRHCPDLSGIVGHGPRGILIVMPTQTGAEFDGAFGGGVFPNGDETGLADGWLVASGTSSAAPMVAGAAALLLQADSTLTPAQIQQTLENTCTDVLVGSSASGEAAGIGPDSATGAGIINIGDAVDEVAPVHTCPRAPLCLRLPSNCSRIPIQCIRGPNGGCLRFPIECVRAPIQCIRGPNAGCNRLPIECLRAPIEICRTAPKVCQRAPVIECRLAPTLPETCPPAPVVGCLAGPWKRPTDEDIIRDPVRIGGRVPVVIMMDEEEAASYRPEAAGWGERAQALAMAAAERAYIATLQEIGMEDEYRDFPEAGQCRRGPFNPNIG